MRKDQKIRAALHANTRRADAYLAGLGITRQASTYSFGGLGAGDEGSLGRKRGNKEAFGHVLGSLPLQ